MKPNLKMLVICMILMILTPLSSSFGQSSPKMSDYTLKIVNAPHARAGQQASVLFKMIRNSDGADVTNLFFTTKHNKGWMTCCRIRYTQTNHTKDTMWPCGGYVSSQYGLVISMPCVVPNSNNIMISMSFDDGKTEIHGPEARLVCD